MGHGDPVVIHAFLRFQVATKMPLAHEPTAVAGLFQHFRHTGEIGERVAGVWSDLQASPKEKAVHPVLAGHQAGEIARARGRANRIVGVRPFKEDAILCQRVNVRRADVAVAITAKRPRAVVVGHDEDNIRWRGKSRQRKTHTQKPTDHRIIRPLRSRNSKHCL